ncbi:MAG: glycosyl transferase [Verrucomicrobiales bacterium]|nr:glycosyl transferase [Verrucomicrobiales bacterium]
MSLSVITRKRLDQARETYSKNRNEISFAGRAYKNLLAHYYRLVVPKDARILDIGCGSGRLLEQLPNEDVVGVDISPERIAEAKERVPRGTFVECPGEALEVEGTFDYILVAETANLAADVQKMFEEALRVSHDGTRMVINIYNNLWRPFFALGTMLGLRRKTPPANWLSVADVRMLAELAGWEVFESEARVLDPFNIPVIGFVMNRMLAPLFPFFCLTNICVARPRPAGQKEKEYSVTVVVPARNESGHIAEIIERTPEMGLGTELILIEGNSTDDTWEVIQSEYEKHKDSRNIRIMQQSGKGKGNAVRDAFAAATGDILMILDADITVPPEDLPKFYGVIQSGVGEFANGVRLVYPMEQRAMRFLNMCANKLFGILFSWLVGQPMKDTLCGTKVLLRTNYEQIAENRSYFGNFDPFGDFDLIFGARKMNLKIVDIPIRYQERTYGTTNIDRWRHGALLFRMLFFAARKLKFI